jgi:hypothetical protein
VPALVLPAGSSEYNVLKKCVRGRGIAAFSRADERGNCRPHTAHSCRRIAQRWVECRTFTSNRSRMISRFDCWIRTSCACTRSNVWFGKGSERLSWRRTSRLEKDRARQCTVVPRSVASVNELPIPRLAGLHHSRSRYPWNTSTAVPILSFRAVPPVHFLLLLLPHRLSAFRVVKPKASLRRSPHDP